MFLIKFCVSFAAICAVQAARCNNMKTLINDNFVNEYDKQIILAAHNEVRNLVSIGRFFGQPKPRRPLVDLMWDDDLARLAMEAALNCEVNIVDQNASNYDCVGQNNWARKTHTFNDTIDWHLPIDNWIDKVNNFIYPATAKDGEMIGQYTQIVWADTTYIGCAAVQYQDKYRIEGDDDRYVYFVVCNYGECGNILDEAPYRVATMGTSEYEYNMQRMYN